MRHFLLESYAATHIMRGMNALSYIRKHVFQLNQTEFASLAGVRQSTVSRWEDGMAPSLDEMAAIRREAIARGIDWDDRWFFEIPAEGQNQPAA